MSFQLVPKSVTLNDLERHNGCYFSANSVVKKGMYRNYSSMSLLPAQNSAAYT